jgi:hypothetical protein
LLASEKPSAPSDKEAGFVSPKSGSTSSLLTPLEAEELLWRITFKVRIEQNAEGAWEWGTGFFYLKRRLRAHSLP